MVLVAHLVVVPEGRQVVRAALVDPAPVGQGLVDGVLGRHLNH